MACSALDTEKDLGWRVKGVREQLAPGMVAARHFNNVQLEGDYVVKTASRSVLRGEVCLSLRTILQASLNFSDLLL